MCSLTVRPRPHIWALSAVVWVGLGPFAGIIALTVHSVASLGKLYSEAIESIDSGPIEAIEAVQATGATRLQTIMYAVVPQMIAPFVSFSIYRWDINVRMSTVIGLVGGGNRGLVYRGHRGGAGLRELGDPSALRIEAPRRAPMYFARKAFVRVIASEVARSSYSKW